MTPVTPSLTPRRTIATPPATRPAIPRLAHGRSHQPENDRTQETDARQRR
jgi:hypothetical protein